MDAASQRCGCPWRRGSAPCRGFTVASRAWFSGGCRMLPCLVGEGGEEAATSSFADQVMEAMTKPDYVPDTRISPSV